MPTVVCVSDTHGRHDRVVVPPGDVLVFAGDLSNHGTLDDVERFDFWLGTLPHPHKIVICGNHDWCFERQPAAARTRLTNATYLEDDTVEVAGLTVHGSPWTPRFFDWAFNLDRGRDIAEKWALIPDRVDVLITHGPPAGVLDLTRYGDRAGCADLLARVRAVRPALHVFGHIHEATGAERVGDTLFVNASRPGVGSGVAVAVQPGRPAELIERNGETGDFGNSGNLDG